MQYLWSQTGFSILEYVFLRIFVCLGSEQAKLIFVQLIYIKDKIEKKLIVRLYAHEELTGKTDLQESNIYIYI